MAADGEDSLALELSKEGAEEGLVHLEPVSSNLAREVAMHRHGGWRWPNQR